MLQGGALTAHGATTILRSEFIGNSASGNAGALSGSDSSIVTISESSFINNTVSTSVKRVVVPPTAQLS